MLDDFPSPVITLGQIMAKPNYSFEKRQKELAKKKKKEEKKEEKRLQKSSAEEPIEESSGQSSLHDALVQI